MGIISNSSIGGSVVEPSQKGDLVTFSNTPVNFPLAPAIDGKVLTQKSSTDTGLIWQFPVANKGGIISNNGSIPFEVPLGTQGQILTVDSSATAGFKFDDNPFNVFLAKGDLIGFNGSVPVRIAESIFEGQVLAVKSSDPSNLDFVNPTGSAVGNLIVNNGSPSPAILPVGTTNGEALIVDNGVTAGIKYGIPTQKSRQIIFIARPKVYDSLENSNINQEIPVNNEQDELLSAYTEGNKRARVVFPFSGVCSNFAVDVVSMTGASNQKTEIFLASKNNTVFIAMSNLISPGDTGQKGNSNTLTVTAGDTLVILTEHGVLTGGLSDVTLILKQLSFVFTET